ncbi:hypothetical protein [Lacrimispora saccharolytica]|uniref:hypothetical protein n=1 Tax=Lacrimispora saccharolytica TaxID=84030 RepID=UPI0005A22425|nr:hypothetical protein [Lacrimispora saccharolytica]QRV18106.1 hypothetical protein I6K70_11005 [Lacrimispora saccharolytica]
MPSIAGQRWLNGHKAIDYDVTNAIGWLGTAGDITETIFKNDFVKVGNKWLGLFANGVDLGSYAWDWFNKKFLYF